MSSNQISEVIIDTSLTNITKNNKISTNTSIIETEIEYEIEIDPNDTNIDEAIKKAILEQTNKLNNKNIIETKKQSIIENNSNSTNRNITATVSQQERDSFENEKADNLASINVAQQEIKASQAFIQKERQQLINDKAAFDLQKNEFNQLKNKLLKEKSEFETISKNYQSQLDAAISNYESQINEKVQEYIDENAKLKNQIQSQADQIARITAERDFLRSQRIEINNQQQTIENLELSYHSESIKKSTTSSCTVSVQQDIINK